MPVLSLSSDASDAACHRRIMSTPTAHTRTLVSYDDITSPQNASAATSQVSQHDSTQPPSKKRKRSAKPRKRKVKHRDGPDSLEESSVYAGEFFEETGDPEAEEEEENRELTYGEIWDDSVLIEAWNAAAEEYEVCHFISFSRLCTFR
jgi:hypothetical protein